MTEQPAQLRDSGPKRRKEYEVSDRYDPLGTCTPEQQAKYEKVALRAAAGSLPAMVRLKCLECCCWNSAEVKRCEITRCALWARARREEITDE